MNLKRKSDVSMPALASYLEREKYSRSSKTDPDSVLVSITPTEVTLSEHTNIRTHKPSRAHIYAQADEQTCCF